MLHDLRSKSQTKGSPFKISTDFNKISIYRSVGVSYRSDTRQQTIYSVLISFLGICRAISQYDTDLCRSISKYSNFRCFLAHVIHHYNFVFHGDDHGHLLALSAYPAFDQPQYFSRVHPLKLHGFTKYAKYRHTYGNVITLNLDF